ncbi:MAG: calcium-translocating P-type ATPase, PMCA-type [Clostridia bacterium]|nr:calcium-translocating P-type ATPase, PMCA-type [Clostridia bacterium]
MRYYLEESEKVLKEFDTGRAGLSSAEAEARLLKNGKNKLKEPEKDSVIKRLLKQMADPMIIILIVAAAISAVTSILEHEFPVDVIIILVVVIINAVLGVVQESKAEKAIEALQKMSAATSKVKRDGRVVHIPSEDLVAGDVVILEAGDAVPADGRILESASLKIEEASLTGESVPVDKYADAMVLRGDASDIPLADRHNMAYMGSVAVYGRGSMVVTDTGMDTEMGKIATAIQDAKDSKTPLQQKLAQLSGILSKLVIGICIFIFLFGVVRQFITGQEHDLKFFLNTFMLAVSLAVAAIPEGLVAVVTIALSIGVTNMSKKNAIIRKLTAVETLGCAQIICSDKTGTLTQNKMTVVDSWGIAPEKLSVIFALCCDSVLEEDGNIQGEPTENALVDFANRLGLKKYEIEKEEPRVGEVPFDSMRKMMTTLHKKGDKIIQCTKGAPDELLKRCSYYFAEDGSVQPLDEEMRAKILEQNHAFAERALRVLAAATREWECMPKKEDSDIVEKDMCFCGLVGMIDPVRPEVKASIEECHNAGIRPIMITGDHLDTAVAIAKELGILHDERGAITGAQLSEISDEEFEKKVGMYSVYARVQPEHKVRIVNAWRKRGMITAMTGDGVNDAPSIKSADIGVGMGITGTDVTKNVADMVLADDNFATIVTAVAEGRRIYDNIRKAIQFLLSSNLSEVAAIFIANLFGFTILRPVHLLWINLVTDCFPALALSTEKAEEDIMRRPPRRSRDGIFAGGVGGDCIYQGLLVTLLVVTAYFVGHLMEGGTWTSLQSDDGITMAFLTMSMAEIFHSLNMRSQRKSIIGMALKGNHNRFLIYSTVGSLLLTTAVIYVPFLRNAFGFTSISFAEYSVALGLAFLMIPAVEIVKAFQRRIAKKRAENET